MRSSKKSSNFVHTKKGWLKLELLPKDLYEGPYGELALKVADDGDNSQVQIESCQENFEKYKNLTKDLKRRKWITKEVKRIDEECAKRKASCLRDVLSVSSSTSEEYNTIGEESRGYSHSQTTKRDYESTRTSGRKSTFDSKLIKSLRHMGSDEIRYYSRGDIKHEEIRLHDERKSEELALIGYQGDDEEDDFFVWPEDEVLLLEEPELHIPEVIEPVELGSQGEMPVMSGNMSTRYDSKLMSLRVADGGEDYPLSERRRLSFFPDGTLSSNYNVEFFDKESSISEYIEMGEGEECQIDAVCQENEDTENTSGETELTSFEQMKRNFKFYTQDEEGLIQEVGSEAIDPNMYQLMKELAIHCIHRKKSVVSSDSDVATERRKTSEETIEEETPFEKCMKEVKEETEGVGKEFKKEEILEEAAEEHKKGEEGDLTEEGTDIFKELEDRPSFSLDDFPKEGVKSKITTKMTNSSQWTRAIHEKVLNSILDREVNVKGANVKIRQVLGPDKVRELFQMKFKKMHVEKKHTYGSAENFEAVQLYSDGDLTRERGEKKFMSGESEAAAKWKELEGYLAMKKKELEEKHMKEEETLGRLKGEEMEKIITEHVNRLMEEEEAPRFPGLRITRGLEVKMDLLTRSGVELNVEEEDVKMVPEVNIGFREKQVTFEEIESYVKRKVEKHFLMVKKKQQDGKAESKWWLHEEEEVASSVGKSKRFIYPKDMNISLGPVELPSGSKYNGMWNYLGMNNCGFFLTPGGLIIESSLKDGLFEGDATIYFPNGSILHGKFVKGHLTSPKYTFSDGLEYSHNDWWYLKWPDRRFYSEIMNNELKGNRITNDCPARKVPKGCLDMGEGFYCPKSNYIHHPVTLEPIRIPSETEKEWIMLSCRKGWDECVSLTKHLHEYLFPVDFDNDKFDLEWDDFSLGEESVRTRRLKLSNPFDEVNRKEDRWYEPSVYEGRMWRDDDSFMKESMNTTSVLAGTVSSSKPKKGLSIEKHLQVERRTKGAQEIIDKMTNYYNNYKVDILRPMMNKDEGGEGQQRAYRWGETLSDETLLERVEKPPNVTREKQYRQNYRELTKYDKQQLTNYYDSFC